VRSALSRKAFMFRRHAFNLTAIISTILLVLGLGVTATALAPVANFSVRTNTTTAALSWQAFSKGKVTSIQVTAQLGKTKKIRTLAATATKYTYTSLTQNSNYTFTVSGIKANKTLYSSSITMRTKKILQYNSIFFGQPKDMQIGDEDQLLFASPLGGPTVYNISTPTTCQIVNESFVRALAVGDCVITASSPGDTVYGPAANEVRTFAISAPLGSLEKTLLWSEEFNAASLDTDTWTHDIGDGCNTSAGCGWGNGESQSYAECALTIANGVMTISATTATGNPNCRSNKTWTSSKITSYGKRDFTYGYFEAKAKVPAGGGAWPAFWLLGSNIRTTPWPLCGEIDIMEYTGNVPGRSTSAIHYANSSGSHDYKSGAATSAMAYSNDYHTYGLLWLPGQMTFYVDGKPSFNVKKSDTGLTRWPFGPDAQNTDPKMYLIFNLAMGGGYGGQIERGLTKADFNVDYVRYYRVAGYGSTN
jgi:beta-glucanase (GH16 family)